MAEKLGQAFSRAGHFFIHSLSSLKFVRAVGDGLRKQEKLVIHPL